MPQPLIRLLVNATEVMKELERLGSPQTKKTFLRHGCPEPFFGVKIGDLKKIVKRIKKDTSLAKELYRTGNSDAMYLAGLIADGSELSLRDLDEWAKKAPWHMISGYTVPWVATENPDGWGIALKWIDSPEEKISSSGWCTLGSIVSVREDQVLDLKAVEKLISRVEKTIAKSPNRTRSAMNTFIISVGGYVKALSKSTIATAERIGKVEVDMGDTDCRVPYAPDYIRKMIERGSLGKKRKMVKC